MCHVAHSQIGVWIWIKRILILKIDCFLWKIRLIDYENSNGLFEQNKFFQINQINWLKKAKIWAMNTQHNQKRMILFWRFIYNEKPHYNPNVKCIPAIHVIDTVHSIFFRLDDVFWQRWQRFYVFNIWIFLLKKKNCEICYDFVPSLFFKKKMMMKKKK